MKNLLDKIWIWLGGETQSNQTASASPMLDLSAQKATPSPPPITPPPASRRLAGRTIVVKAGDTLPILAQRYNISVESLLKMNSLKESETALQIGQTLFVPPASSGSKAVHSAAAQPVAYRVRSDDSLGKIAEKFGASLEQIKTENKLEDPEKLLPGQWLVIPAVATTNLRQQALSAKPSVPDEPVTPELDSPIETKSGPAPAPVVGKAVPLPFKKLKKPEPVSPPLKQQKPKPASPPPPQQKPVSAPSAPPLETKKPTEKPVQKPAQSARPAPQQEQMKKPTVPPPIKAKKGPAVDPAPSRQKASPPTRAPKKKPAVPPAEDFDLPPLQKEVFEPDIPPQTGPVIPPKPAVSKPSPVQIQRPKSPPEPLKVPPGATQGIYLAYHVLTNQAMYPRIMQLIEETDINSLVIDFKNDSGYLSYPVSAPLAKAVGATKLVPRHLPALLKALKKKNIYLVARVVTFRDSLLAKAFPEWAGRYQNGAQVWQDTAQFAWVDPFLPEVWAYNLDIATAAARAGFDEIQFDYARFPAPKATGTPQFSQALNLENRSRAISGFLSSAYGALSLLGVRVSATLWGYACWRKDDSLVGQQLERMAPYLDTLAPILFPATFEQGVPACPNPLAQPDELVYQAVKTVQTRLQTAGLEASLKPWIQDFPLSDISNQRFSATQVQAQMRGAFKAKAGGYLAWNSAFNYTASAYKTQKRR